MTNAGLATCQSDADAARALRPCGERVWPSLVVHNWPTAAPQRGHSTDCGSLMPRACSLRSTTRQARHAGHLNQ